MDRSFFKFKTRVQVRNYEIDWQGIVHNATYLLYFETARVEYLKNLGIRTDVNSIQHDYRVVLVRNEIDYRSPGHFDEILDVHTRVSHIKNMSFTFEAFMEETMTKRLVAENVAVHVWLDPRTVEPTRVSDEFRKLVERFEGKSVTIDRGTPLS